MNEIDRHTDPKDNGWHAAQSLTIFALSGFVIVLVVRFVMGLHPEVIDYLIGIAWCFTPFWLYVLACLARPAFLSVERNGAKL